MDNDKGDEFFNWLESLKEGEGDQVIANIEDFIKIGNSEEFLCFAIYMGTLMSPHRPVEHQVSSREIVLTAWALTRPGIKSKLFNFSKGLNERLEANPDTKGIVLSGAAVQFFAPNGVLLVEVVAIGAKDKALSKETLHEAVISQYAAEAAAEVGYTLDVDQHMNDRMKKVTTNGATITDAFKQQHERIIDEQTAKFRAELDTVFNTWKGGDTNGGSSE